MLGEREAADSERGRIFIELARPRVHVPERKCGYCNRPLATTYCGCFWEEQHLKQCRQCGSYQHSDADHSEQGVPLADRPEA